MGKNNSNKTVVVRVRDRYDWGNYFRKELAPNEAYFFYPGMISKTTVISFMNKNGNVESCYDELTADDLAQYNVFELNFNGNCLNDRTTNAKRSTINKRTPYLTIRFDNPNLDWGPLEIKLLRDVIGVTTVNSFNLSPIAPYIYEGNDKAIVHKGDQIRGFHYGHFHYGHLGPLPEVTCSPADDIENCRQGLIKLYWENNASFTKYYGMSRTDIYNNVNPYR
jgi:hypothetical protein